MQERRVVVIHNPNSSASRDDPGRIERDVFNELSAARINFSQFETPSADYDDNVSALSEVLLEGDRVLVASGDGVASQVANAAVNKDVDLAFMAWGGFNDLAHTFGTHSAAPSQLALSNRIELFAPLRIEVDGEFKRYAIGYATLGETARAGSRFMNDEERALIAKYGRRLVMAKSLGRLGLDYLQRRKEIQLPAFELDDVKRDNISDVLALNLGRMASLRHQDWRERPDTFTFDLRNGRKPQDYANFVIVSLVRGIRAEQRSHIEVEFDEPATFMGQSEGEAFELIDVTKVSIEKDVTEGSPLLHAVSKYAA